MTPHRGKLRRPPPKVSIRARWFLPEPEPHVSIPFSALSVLTAQLDLGAEEMRVVLWLIADWYWPAGLSREINAAVIGQRCGIDRANVHRALRGLAKKGVIEIDRRGRGSQSIVSIEPLIRKGRLAASAGVSTGYSKKGRSSPKPPNPSLECQPDTPTPVFDTPGSVKREPGDVPSELSSSDSFNRRGQAASAGSSSPDGPDGPQRPTESMRRAALLEQLAAMQAKEAS